MFYLILPKPKPTLPNLVCKFVNARTLSTFRVNDIKSRGTFKLKIKATRDQNELSTTKSFILSFNLGLKVHHLVIIDIVI